MISRSILLESLLLNEVSFRGNFIMNDLTTDTAAGTWRFDLMKRIELMKRLVLAL